RVHLGISTGGHYVSEDGGATFAAANTGVGAAWAPVNYPEFGQCVHKIAGHPDAPGRFYMQNHGADPKLPDIGVLRSDDHGSPWSSVPRRKSASTWARDLRPRQGDEPGRRPRRVGREGERRSLGRRDPAKCRRRPNLRGPIEPSTDFRRGTLGVEEGARQDRR